jgi:hypothetical protein
MKTRDRSIFPLIGLSVFLSMAAMIAAAAAIASHSTTVVKYAAPKSAVARGMAQMHTVRVIMHDPGCHWFQTSHGLKQSMTVTGTVNLMNMDEAALKVVGPNGTRIEKIGAPLRLGAGTYRITMVGQASDDNHLRLTVKS